MKTSILKNLSHDLDNELGLIGSKTETLTDVDNLLSQLVNDMRTAVLKGEEKLYYQEHFRQLRILAELMFYSMAELNENYEKTQEIHQNMFNLIMNKSEIQKNPIAGNDKAFA